MSTEPAPAALYRSANKTVKRLTVDMTPALYRRYYAIGGREWLIKAIGEAPLSSGPTPAKMLSAEVRTQIRDADKTTRSFKVCKMFNISNNTLVYLRRKIR